MIRLHTHCTSLSLSLLRPLQGFREIQNLEEYTGLKVLWLEGNGLTKIQGLTAQTGMRTLYLQENLLETMEGLDSMVALDTLNLSKNFIKRIAGIEALTQLSTLILSHNKLTSGDDVRAVLQCPALQTLDLQHNTINDPAVVDIVAAMPGLRVLYLLGNPVVKEISHYRKTIISRCADLRYLDDRPVFEEERLRCNAWAKGLAAGAIHIAWLVIGRRASVSLKRLRISRPHGASKRN